MFVDVGSMANPLGSGEEGQSWTPNSKMALIVIETLIFSQLSKL